MAWGVRKGLLKGAPWSQEARSWGDTAVQSRDRVSVPQPPLSQPRRAAPSTSAEARTPLWSQAPLVWFLTRPPLIEG